MADKYTGKGRTLTDAQLLAQMEQRGLLPNTASPVETPEQPQSLLMTMQTKSVTTEEHGTMEFRRLFLQAGEVYFDDDFQQVESFSQGSFALSFLPNHNRMFVTKDMIDQKLYKGITRPGTYVVPVLRNGDNKTEWILGAVVFRFKVQFNMMGSVREQVVRVNGTLGTGLWAPNDGHPTVPAGWTSFDVSLSRNNSGANSPFYDGMSHLWNAFRRVVAQTFGAHFNFGDAKTKIIPVMVNDYKETFQALALRSSAGASKTQYNVSPDQWETGEEVDSTPNSSAVNNPSMGASRPARQNFGGGWS